MEEPFKAQEEDEPDSQPDEDVDTDVSSESFDEEKDKFVNPLDKEETDNEPDSDESQDKPDESENNLTSETSDNDSDNDSDKIGSPINDPGNGDGAEGAVGSDMEPADLENVLQPYNPRQGDRSFEACSAVPCRAVLHRKTRLSSPFTLHAFFVLQNSSPGGFCLGPSWAHKMTPSTCHPFSFTRKTDPSWQRSDMFHEWEWAKQWAHQVIVQCKLIGFCNVGSSCKTHTSDNRN